MSSLSGFRIEAERFFNFPKMFRFLAFVDSLWRTGVLLIFEPTWNVRSTRKLVEVKTDSAKVTSFFTASISKSYATVLAAEHEFAFHAVKQHSSYKTADCTSVLFNRIFLASDITCKYSIAQTKIKQSLTW